jgi:hypothetical protein
VSLPSWTLVHLLASPASIEYHRPVDPQQLLDELVQAARRLGVEVRSEPFETPAAMGGGLCLVRGAHLVLIDQRAPLVDRLGALARALGNLGSEAVYMAPEARELVDRGRTGF